MDLMDKIAIVTGAGSGIGAAIALKLSEAGVKLTIIDKDCDNLISVADKCKQYGCNPLTIVGDLTEDDIVRKSVSETIKHFGKLDILINNAGIGKYVKITDDNALDIFDKVMAINLRAAVSFTHSAAPYLIQSKGSIVNISSISSLRPTKITGFAYNTSKAALDHFSKTMAVELGAEEIRVNTIHPGPTRTNVLKNSVQNCEMEAERWRVVTEATILKRISEPEEIADLVLFIVSAKGNSITGASYVIDNGGVAMIWSMHKFEVEPDIGRRDSFPPNYMIRDNSTLWKFERFLHIDDLSVFKDKY